MTYEKSCEKICKGSDLMTVCPKVASMWSAKNNYSTHEVSTNSNKRAIFVCPDCKQEFETRICNVVRSVKQGTTGCPVCAGRKVVSGINDLETVCPKVVPMWSVKNDYAPHDIPARSSRRAFFVCPSGNSHIASGWCHHSFCCYKSHCIYRRVFAI